MKKINIDNFIKHLLRIKNKMPLVIVRGGLYEIPQETKKRK